MRITGQEVNLSWLGSCVWRHYLRLTVTEDTMPGFVFSESLDGYLIMCHF